MGQALRRRRAEGLSVIRLGPGPLGGRSSGARGSGGADDRAGEGERAGAGRWALGAGAGVRAGDLSMGQFSPPGADQSDQSGRVGALPPSYQLPSYQLSWLN